MPPTSFSMREVWMSLCRMGLLVWRQFCPTHLPTIWVCVCVQLCEQSCAERKFADVSV